MNEPPRAPPSSPGAAARLAMWPLRLLRHLLQWLLALLVLFEEWGWEPLQRALGRLARLPPLAALERAIGRLRPYPALAVFALPALALLPVKLAALGLIAKGHALLGVSVVVAAKLLGTALVARLYQLTQPALLQLDWFARWHARWAVFKERLLALARASWPWRVARVLKRQWSRRFAHWRRSPQRRKP